MGDASLREQLSSVPTSPGVYLWKDAAGDVLYIGKAKSLRSRMRSYLSPRHDDRPKIEPMMEAVASFDYVVTDSEIDSLILEANLIKQFRPPYNVDYRDDKSYPFLALTVSDRFPAIKYTRERHRRGTRYFGPYTDAKAARQTIEAVRRVYPICAATCAEWRRLVRNDGEPLAKACFDFHVGRGPGACIGEISPEEYARTVTDVARFLEGHRSGVVGELEERMEAAAADLDFEHAARLRNAIAAVEKVLERQTVVSDRPLDLDVIGLVREETIAAVHMLVVREGRVLAGNEFVLDQGMDVPEAELVEGFLLRHYGEATHVPKEVVVGTLPDESELFEEWLCGLRGSRVGIRSPQRGEKRRLLEMADTNAGYALARYKHRTRYDEHRLNRALLELESALALAAPPMRIECYDISTLHGRHSVGSMVVFTAGRPDLAGYRRFRVRAETGEANDVAMLGEVLARRFARTEDGRFAKRPDLVIVDGGKPQLTAARAALDAVGADVPVVALAKREEELFVPAWEEPVTLPAGSASLHLVKRVRDEAHRFAVTYHRDLRSKAMTASVLDEVPGVGPKRKKALLASFGSLKRLREASADDVAAVPGIPRDVAEDVVATLRDTGGA